MVRRFFYAYGLATITPSLGFCLAGLVNFLFCGYKDKMSNQPEFDFRGFIADNWSGIDPMLSFLQQYGVEDVNRPAAYKWGVRGSIPADKFAVLLALLEIDTGKPVSLSRWLKQ